MDMITPTNGALLAMLLGAKVSYGRWVKFAVPGAIVGAWDRSARVGVHPGFG